MNVLHWYGLGCAAEADFEALVNFVIALDVLSNGGEESGIRRLAARLLKLAEEGPILTDGTTLKQFVKRLYSDARILNIFEVAAEIRAQLIAQSLLEGGKWIGSAPIA